MRSIRGEARRGRLGPTASGLALGLVALSIPATAHAVDHRVCLDFTIGGELWDTSRGDETSGFDPEFWEEYGRDITGEVNYPAQRWLARITDNGQGQVVWGWGPLDADGCANIDVPTTSTTFTVEWVRWAIWDAAADGGNDPQTPDTGNQIFGYECVSSTEVVASSCVFNTPNSLTVAANTIGATTQVTAGDLTSDETLSHDLPLWSASFAEERFATLGQAPTTDSIVYVTVDPGGDPPQNIGEAIPRGTFSSRLFGGQASCVFQGDTAWRSKFTAAHEYGHTQTTIVNSGIDDDDLDETYGTNPTQGGHQFDTQEWQALAAVEGMADWYAVSTWNDVDAVVPGTCTISCAELVYFVDPEDAETANERRITRPGGPACEDDLTNELICADGVSKEWDWVSALYVSRQSANPADFETMFTMLSEIHNNQTWHPDGEDDDFWQACDAEMASHLGSAYSDWVDAAEAWRLDR